MSRRLREIFSPIASYDLKEYRKAVNQGRYTSPSVDIDKVETVRIDAADIDIEPDHAKLFYFEENGFFYDFFYCPQPGAKQLYVVFSGAKGRDTNLPMFKRQSWNGYYDSDTLYASDPIFRKYPEIDLGWYTGDGDAYPLECIAKMTTQLKFAEFLPCCAIAINPQINPMAYGYWDTFQKILGVEHIKAIRTRLPLNFDKQSSFLIIQNDTDTNHMERQLFPLLKSVSMYPRYGLSNRGNLHVWIYHAFGGHNA